MAPRSLVVWRLASQAANTVLLTFDDGPHPEVTPGVLERLDAYQARAVFFVKGRRVRKAVPVLKAIRERGHLVGNHTHLHRDSYVLSRLRPMSYYRDCVRCQELLTRHLGARPTLFRAPGGRLTPTTLAVPKLLGMRCINWSVDVGDWRFRKASEAKAGAEELLRAIAPGDIVLLHDDNPCVLDLLDVLLPGLQARRYDLSSGIDYL